MNQTKFRCSMLGNLMKNDRSGKKMGETAKKELRRIWIGEKYNRWKSIDTKFIRKGNKQEEEALTLLSMFDKKMYVKNQMQFSNEYLTGTPDIIYGDETIDTKCSWDIFTFYNSVDDDLDPMYDWQGRGYMKLSTSVKHTVVHCLVNTPDDEITNELYRDSFNWQGNEAPLWAKILKVSEMIYDERNFHRYLRENNLWPATVEHEAVAIFNAFKEVPMEERIHKKSFEHDEQKITELYSRLDECRTHIQTFK